jgi:hypothetical protein
MRRRDYRQAWWGCGRVDRVPRDCLPALHTVSCNKAYASADAATKYCDRIPYSCVSAREIQQTNNKATQHITATKWHLHAAFFIIGNCTDAVLYTVQTDHQIFRSPGLPIIHLEKRSMLKQLYIQHERAAGRRSTDRWQACSIHTIWKSDR